MTCLIERRLGFLLNAEALARPIFAGEEGSALHDSLATLTYIDTGNAVNLDTSEVGVLKPATGASTQDASAAPNTAIGAAPYHGTIFSKDFQLQPGKTVTHIGIHMNSAGSFPLKICRRVSATEIDILVSHSIGHAGAGWQASELPVPFEVPATGEYYVGAYTGANNPAARSGLNKITCTTLGNATGSSVTTTETTGSTFSMQVIYAGELLDMTVSSMPIQSVGEPSTISLLALISGDDVVGSDANFSVSRDEGATWAPATMAHLYDQVGGVRVMRSGPIDVSAHPSGENVQWKLETHNAANIKLHGVAIWGDA